MKQTTLAERPSQERAKLLNPRRPGHPPTYTQEQVLECIACYLETGSITAARKLTIERDRERDRSGTPRIFPNGRVPADTTISVWLAQAEAAADDIEEQERQGLPEGLSAAISKVAAQQKRTLEELVYAAAATGATRTAEALADASARDAAVATGIMIDKLALLRDIGGGRLSGQNVAVQIVLKGGDAAI